MAEHRRNPVAGGTYFFAVNRFDRRSDRLGRRIDALRNATHSVRARRPLKTDTRVMRTDCLHCVARGLRPSDWLDGDPAPLAAGEGS